MNNEFRKILSEIEKHENEFCYQSAIDKYKLLLDRYPDHTIFCSYQLGAIYQTKLGFGNEAKKKYLNVIEWNKKHPHFMQDNLTARKEIDKIVANTYENLSTLSDSYHEMFDWAKKLWEINPTEDILRETIESTKNAQKKGIPWRQTYFELAQLYWNAEPSKDPGLHGFGASIYERLLINRKKFRLDRLLFRYCANGYAGLMTLIISKIGQNMERKFGYVLQSEINFILDKPITLLNEYLELNSNDNRVKENLDFLYEVKKKANGENKTGRKITNMKPIKFSFKKILNLIASGILGYTTTMLISAKYGYEWSYLQYFAGAIAGLIIIYPILTFAQKKEKELKSKLDEKMGNPKRSEGARCSKCGTTIHIQSGLINLNSTENIQGCFQCKSCGRYTCFDCSDASQNCKCGSNMWIEKMYT
jgi:hypothetical protein